MFLVINFYGVTLADIMPTRQYFLRHVFSFFVSNKVEFVLKEG